MLNSISVSLMVCCRNFSSPSEKKQLLPGGGKSESLGAARVKGKKEGRENVEKMLKI